MTNKMQQEIAKVVSQKELAQGIFDMWIETKLVQSAKAGQFISVYANEGSTLLPRPISICEINEEKSKLRIVYRVVGKGTDEFSGYTTGDSIRILGTIGNGFPVEMINESYKGKTVVLMGGGIGVPPMLQTAKSLDEKPIMIMGYRNDQLFLKEDMDGAGNVFVATEDGSVGTKGNVLDVLKECEITPDVIMACGPMPMLRAIKAYAADKGIKAYISLEERMACGVGACLGCVCKTKEKDHHSHVNNARVCTEGPVFEAEEVEI